MLLQHFNKYPQMQILDMIKLIYQNEFGSGHLITDEKESLKFIKEETSLLQKKNHIFDPIEPIGNNHYRLHLQILLERDLKTETFNRFFLVSASHKKGNLDCFHDKISIFMEMCKIGELPFHYETVSAILSDYKNNGYPLVRHSNLFRECYAPAYRVVEKEFCFFLELFSKIDKLMAEQKHVIIGIDGNCGAGKSTLADLLQSVYDCNVFHMDDFFLQPEQRTAQRLMEIGGNVDYVRFRTEVMEQLLVGSPFSYKKFDCRLQNFSEPTLVYPKALTIVEGAYSLHPTLSNYYHQKVFLQLDKKEQSLRILNRNGAFMHKRFITEWIPLENNYFQKMNIRETADLEFVMDTLNETFKKA